MACLTMLDSKAAIAPEDKRAHNTSPHKAMANLGPDKSQLSFSPSRADSPIDKHLSPNTRTAGSHQSQVDSHRQEFHATSAGEQLSGCHHGTKFNSTSQVKLWLQPHRSSNLSSAGMNNTHRFIPYFNQTKNPHTPAKSSEPDCLSGKAPKPRKRTVIIKPKFPKYEGLSNFAAPVDLVSDMIPCQNTNDQEKSSSSPALKSVSRLDTDEISRESNTDSTNTAHPTEENSPRPIDFLKHLESEEWDRRKQDLLQMVEDRKKLFLLIGFAETSGKPFQPNEQAIEKKPIPNRWVWYMHLSTDYDKLNNTRVPPGGPAGYLKYGWDRLGPAGKQAYQELADIYSGQRLKFMAAHGITEENAKKKPKQIEKLKTQRHSPKELMIRDDRNPTTFMNEPLFPHEKMTTQSINESLERPNVHIDAPFMPLQPILQCNLLYQQLNPFVHEKLDCNCLNGPTDISEINEAPSYPSYLRSPEIPSDYFSPYYNEAGYGSYFNFDCIQPLGAPIGFPTSPNEYAPACSRSSMIPCQATSEMHSQYTLSPESVHSANSDISGVFSTSNIDNRPALASPFGSFPPLDPFCVPFHRQ